MLHETALDHVTGLVIKGKKGKYAATCEKKHISMHKKYVVLQIINNGHQR